MDVLTVYTARECCLCDEAKLELERMQAELAFEVDYVDITGDAELEEAHRSEIPVGYLAGRKVFKYHVNADMLRRRLPARG